MPITVAPVIDDRKYQDLLDEALARIPVHNPEWKNFNASDPGITLIELFAFLTESLLFRANQIPERNRRKFLSLLGIPLQPGSAANGIVAFTNDRGSLATITLGPDLELRAGEVAFRTTQAVDVLPVETRLFWKRERPGADEELKEYYRSLYASYRSDAAPADLKLYDTVAFSGESPSVIDLNQTVDRSLWIALLLRASDRQEHPGAEGLVEALAKVRKEIAHKTLTLGVVPALDAAPRQLRAGRGTPEGMPLVEYRMPKVQPNGGLRADRKPEYRLLDAMPGADVLAVPGVVQITLPTESELVIWNDMDPLESGVGDFPPTLEDTAIEDRLVTWLRVQPAAGAPAQFLWAGINAAMVVQRVHVRNELLPEGTGEPDQVVTLARRPVVPGTVAIAVRGSTSPWLEIDDLHSAGPEAASQDLRRPPGVSLGVARATDVFEVDSESGVVRFGDGAHGRRPPQGAWIRASYDYSVGAAGNVGAGSISSGPSLPPAVKVTNPVRTWGGASPETVAQGEKQVSRYLQHRDRAVTAEDFKTIVERTPGIELGRVDVLPAYDPRLTQDEPGGAAGAVTLLVIPRFDAEQPDAPQPDRLFIDAVCRYLDPRRLVTTEVFVYGPSYQPVWVSVGIKVVGGVSVPQVREAVRQELLDFLSPLAFDRETADGTRRFEAWPLRKPVVDRELITVASRVKGVMLVTNLLVAGKDGVVVPSVPMRGLQLPRVTVSVVDGDPVGIEQLRGAVSEGVVQATPGSFVPVPIIPERC